ncbi:hypothetical protein FJZ53_03730, partial [Candidatus Woesearchaeota archaeon]|nr:hypothetical protein [Candidatus Woesearchaeota archaeon]
MAAVNDNTLLEYLVENLDSSLSSKYPTKTLLALDYCFKSSERIPQDWLSGIASRVNDKRVNNSSRNISF